MAIRVAALALISASLSTAAQAEFSPETAAGENNPASVAIAPFANGETQAVSVQHSSIGSVFEGDILLQVSASTTPGQVTPRSFGTSQNGSLWPDGILPYTIDGSIGSAVESRIVAAVAHWNAKTPVTVIERTAANASSYPNYVTFTDYGGCASYLGRIGGQQPIYAGSACSTGNIIHEIGHALGLYHEHTRPDRDDHIQLNWGNINSSYSYNFDMVNSNASPTTAYDLGSVMHYGEYFFSTNGQKTIEPAYSTAIYIGQRVGLSDLDIAGVNALYASEIDAGLSVTPHSPYPNQAIAFELTFDNSEHSSLALTSTTVTMPSGTAYAANNNSNWSCSQSGNDVTCSGPTLSIGQSSTLDLAFTAPPSAASDLNFFSSSTATPAGSGPVTHTASASFDMTTQNLAPVITPGQHISVASTTPPTGTLVGRIAAADPNGDPMQSWQLLSTDTPNAVTLDSSTGDLHVDDAAAFASRADDVIVLGVSVSDGSLTSSETTVTLDVGTPSTAALSNSKSESGGGGAALALIALLPALRRRRSRISEI